MMVAAVPRFRRSLSEAAAAPSPRSTASNNNSNSNAILIGDGCGSPSSNHSLSEWSDPRDDDDNNEKDDLLCLVNDNNEKMIMSSIDGPKRATCVDTTPKRKTRSSKSAAIGAVVVTPDRETPLRLQQPLREGQSLIATETKSSLDAAVVPSSPGTAFCVPKRIITTMTYPSTIPNIHHSDEDTASTTRRQDLYTDQDGQGQQEQQSAGDCSSSGVATRVRSIFPCFWQPLFGLDLAPFLDTNNNRLSTSDQNSNDPIIQERQQQVVAGGDDNIASFHSLEHDDEALLDNDDNNAEKQESVCGDFDDLPPNDETSKDEAPMSVLEQAPSTSTATTTNNKNKQRRLFFANNSKNESTGNVRRKKNSFKTFFSSKKEPAEGAATQSSNHKNDSDSSQPTMDMTTPKQQPRKRTGSSSSSFLRIPSFSGRQSQQQQEQHPSQCQEQVEQLQAIAIVTPEATPTLFSGSAIGTRATPDTLVCETYGTGDNVVTHNSATSMECLLSRQARLEGEMHHLFELEKSSQLVQQRALATTSRIVELKNKTLQLQQALQESLSLLQQEESSLQRLEAEQSRIEQATVQAAQQVQDSVVQGLGQVVSSTNTSPTVLSSGISTRGRPPTPKAQSAAVTLNAAPTTKLNDALLRGRTNTASPIMQQQNKEHDSQPQQPVMRRRRAATEDVAAKIFQQQQMQEQEQWRGDSRRVSLPEPATVSLPSSRRRASTEPKAFSSFYQRSSSSMASFMRVNDLEMDVDDTSSSLHAVSEGGLEDGEFTGVGDDAAASEGCEQPRKLSNEDFFFLEENITLVLQQLSKLGLEVSTDESERFTPTRETQRLLQTKSYKDQREDENGWPFSPWHAARDKDVLVWTGGVPHKGFGHDWPVVKARGIVRTTPRHLLEFLLDSAQLKKYNKMSVGRDDVCILQAGVDTKADESLYGFAGDARIFRALNKPKLLPKTMEMISLWYSQALNQSPGSFMIVSRSVWENEMGTHDSSSGKDNASQNMLRCEMLLGVQLLRPVTVPSTKTTTTTTTTACELTTITHVFSGGVPEMMAKRMAPSSAANLIREIQALFP